MTRVENAKRRNNTPSMVSASSFGKTTLGYMESDREPTIHDLQSCEYVMGHILLNKKSLG